MIRKLLCLALCALMLWGACGALAQGNAYDEAMKALMLDNIRFQSLARDALRQYQEGDHTPLAEAQKYRILWLGYARVTYQGLDFRMEARDKLYLAAVARNFEQAVERASGYCLDIEIDLKITERAVELTRAEGADWLYLSLDSAWPDIRMYSRGKAYDSVLTTVHTDGDRNYERNKNVPGYGRHFVMLGLMTHGLENGIGYSTFDLTEPEPDFNKWKMDELGLYGTMVAIHEWMHQLEYLGVLLDIEYPDTHVYQGSENGFAGYPRSDYYKDDFEFTKLVLSGRLPYTQNGKTRLVGMYPAMWPLISRENLATGRFTIENSRGQYLSAREGQPKLTLSEEKCVWRLQHAKPDRVALIPEQAPWLRVDLNNAWDVEGNTVTLQTVTGVWDAQSWRLSLADNGGVRIVTPYASGRVLTCGRPGAGVTLNTADETRADAQEWYLRQVK